MKFNYFDPSGVKHFILDEADRMLDMSFHDDIMAVFKSSLLKNKAFSVTSKIRSLANKILTNPASISLAISKPAAGIQQRAFLVHDSQKVKLTQHLLKNKNLEHVLIFCSTIKSTKELARSLRKVGCLHKTYTPS